MATKDLKMRVSVDGAEQSKAKLTGLNATMKNLISTTAIIAAGVIAVKKAFDLMGKSAAAAEGQIIAMRKLDQTIVSMGKTSQYTSSTLQSLASDIQKVSNFGDEKIMEEAIVSLLRFDSITPAIFNRATRLVADMSAQTGDLAGQSRALGIALEDPILGITRLRRAGVMFSQEQEKMIKGLVETGQKTEAAGVLMSALEQRFAGAARASQTATQTLKNTWGDYLEFLGTKTLPVFDGVKIGINSFFSSVLASQAQIGSDVSANNKIMMTSVANNLAKLMMGVQAALTVFGGVVDSVVTVAVGGIRQIVTTGSEGIWNLLKGADSLMTALGRSVMGWDFSALTDWWDSVSSDDNWSETTTRARTFSDELALLGRNWNSTFGNLVSQLNNIEGMTSSFVNRSNVIVPGLELGDDVTGTGAGSAITTAMDSRKAELLAMIDELRKTGLTEEQILDQQRQAKIAYYGKLIQDARTIYPQITAEEEAVLKKFARWQIEQETKHLAELAAITRQRFEEHLTFVQNRTNAEVEMLKELGTDYAAYEQARMIQIAFEIEQLAKLGIAEEYLIALQQKRINGIPAEFKAISESTTKTITEIDTASKMVNDVTDNMVNGFSSAFANMITAGQSFSDSMVSVFRNMVNQLLAELAKLALFELFKSVFSVGTGGVGGVIGNALGGSGGIKTTNSPRYTPDISTSTTDGQFNRILSRLEQSINNRQPQDVVLRIGNREFRNAIQYSTIEANVM